MGKDQGGKVLESYITPPLYVIHVNVLPVYRCQVCQAGPQTSTSSSQQGDPAREDDISVSVKQEWQKIKGRFIAVNCFVMPCRCALSPEGPASCAHLGDGCIDLVIIHECSRSDYLKHLIKCMDKNADQVMRQI